MTGFARGYIEKAGGSRVVTIAQVFHSTRWNCAQPFQEQERHWQLHTDCAKGQQLPRYKSISSLGVMQLLRMHVLVSERDHEYLEIEKCIWTQPDVPSDLFSCWNTPIFESLTEQSIPIPHINVKQKQQNDFKQMTFLIHHESFPFQVTGSQLQINDADLCLVLPSANSFHFSAYIHTSHASVRSISIPQFTLKCFLTTVCGILQNLNAVKHQHLQATKH